MRGDVLPLQGEIGRIRYDPTLIHYMANMIISGYRSRMSCNSLTVIDPSPVEDSSSYSLLSRTKFFRSGSILPGVQDISLIVARIDSWVLKE